MKSLETYSLNTDLQDWQKVVFWVSAFSPIALLLSSMTSTTSSTPEQLFIKESAVKVLTSTVKQTSWSCSYNITFSKLAV